MASLLKQILRTLFKFHVEGKEILEQKGPVLLVPNHVSWLDWLFLAVVLEEDWKFVVSSRVANKGWLYRKITINSRTFPVEVGSPHGLKEIIKYLNSGGRLVLFAEGRLSTSGSLMKLYDGIGFLIQKSEATLISAYLRGVKRLRWVQHDGWTKWFPKVSLHIRKIPEKPPICELKASTHRQKLNSWLTMQMMQHRFEVEHDSAPEAVSTSTLHAAKEQPNKIIFEDATQQSLSYSKLVIGADIIGREIETEIEQSQNLVGVLLPNINATPVTLLALWFLGKTPSLLNYTSGSSVMCQCAEFSKLKTIVTSRAFIEKANIDIDPFKSAGLDLIFLEDIKKRINLSGKLGALYRFRFEPDLINRGNQKREDTAVVLYTSGSEGSPKGVELSHGNLLANIEQVLSVTDIKDKDRIFNPLPLFHSFGLTIGTILPMTKGLYSFLYPNPLNYKAIPSAIYDLDCTITMGTNTFLSQYGKAAHPMDFRNLRYIFAGAEKLQDNIFDFWNEKFGVRILQGYGATETSPCVSVNTHMFHKKSTTGLPLPGQELKIESIPGVEEGGRILIKGPNVMKGYLNSEPNKKFKALNGWYDTGDIGLIDEDGFLKLLGRLKRFAKISGEMVSLTAIEEILNNHLSNNYDGDLFLAVASAPDQAKGEKIIAFTNASSLTSKVLRDAIKKGGLSPLCVPKEIRVIDELPTLGTGKIDHKALTALAAE